MGLIGKFLTLIFGGGRNAVVETAEVFRVNAEAADARSADLQGAALAQLAAEFTRVRKGWYDRFIDGLNRVPRPAMALGTIGLFVTALVDPVWFAARMQGIAVVPEPLWWLLGAIVSFYFGARHQAKGQEFQTHLAETMSRVPQVIENIRALDKIGETRPGAGTTGTDAQAALHSIEPEANAALEDWRRQRA